MVPSGAVQTPTTPSGFRPAPGRSDWNAPSDSGLLLAAPARTAPAQAKSESSRGRLTDPLGNRITAPNPPMPVYPAGTTQPPASANAAKPAQAARIVPPLTSPPRMAPACRAFKPECHHTAGTSPLRIPDSRDYLRALQSQGQRAGITPADFRMPAFLVRECADAANQIFPLLRRRDESATLPRRQKRKGAGCPAPFLENDTEKTRLY